ncbi:MAG: NAD(P)-dependent oxidoreductase [Candidatus Micrarchaeota archaeon]|nr:NAD(P)-dependent oxidoreductase [Candidatus Micrarchaeota archaeon]
MRILVTGNLGYNGPAVVRRLREGNAFVAGFDSNYYPDLLFSEDGFAPDEQAYGDIRQIPETCLDGMDAVVHLAGLSNDALGEISPALTQKINFEATVRLARMAKSAGCRRFVFASSCSVYGVSDPSSFATEESGLNPLTEYAKAKVLAEKEITALAGDSFSTVNMRNATMHGSAPRIRLDLVLNNLVAGAYLFNKVKILSDGTPWRPLLSVDDFARFAGMFATRGSKEAVYNVGFDAENFRVRELGEMISDATGAALDINPSKTPDERSYRVSFSRLRAESGVGTPVLGVKESIKRMWEVFDENGLTEEDFKSSRYFRIRKLRELMAAGLLDGQLLWAGKAERQG